MLVLLDPRAERGKVTVHPVAFGGDLREPGAGRVRRRGRGDGFDEGANAFRDMPPVRSVVAFEENPEEVEGHYFYISGEEHRVIRLDAIILSFPLE